MKILNVNMSLDPRDGGTSERTVQMTRHLLEAGEDVRILTTDKGLTSERTAPFLDRVVALRCLWQRFYLPSLDFHVIREAVKWADVIHLMGHWTILNAWVYREAHRQGKPFVFCPAGALPIFGRSKYLKKIYNQFVGNALLRNARGFIAITQREISDFAAYGVDLKKITVIPNAIDPNQYLERDDLSFRARWALGDVPFVLFLGRLSPIKGPDLLLQAFASIEDQIRPFHLVFAGPDEGMREALQAAAVQAKIEDRVHFTGHLGIRDKSLALHAASVLAIPSRQEAMSIVALEAGIVGTPVLVTDQCGIDEVERIGGGFVTPATADGIARGLKSISAQTSDSDRKRMGETLQRFCQNNYTWRAMARVYQDFYRRVLSG